MPHISVVIPTYNRKDYLKQAIASCFEGNERVNVEVVIVDDGSTDGTRDFLRQLDDERVRPILQEHQGGQVARNRGLAEAKGKYLKFLDDDDWLAKGALNAEVSALENCNAEISYGGYQWVHPDGTVFNETRAEAVDDIVGALLTGRLQTHLLRFTYRRSLIDGLEWSLNLPCRQDVDFVLQVATKDPSFVHVDRVVARFRQHDGPRVSSDAGAKLDTARVHAKVLLDAIQKMKAREILDPSRRLDAAQGLWTWAHGLAARDLRMFNKLYTEIQSLDPDFSPVRDSRTLSTLDALFCPQATEYMLFPVRRFKNLLA
jgi:hypothetical protein